MPPPSALALLLCASLDLEAGTGKPTLRGLYGKLQAPGRPCVLALCGYAALVWMPGVTAWVGLPLLSSAGETVHQGTMPATFPPNGALLPLVHTERVTLSTAGQSRFQGAAAPCVSP
jgi:hypothetical protein